METPNHDYALEPVKSVADFADEVEGTGEWMKKRDLVGVGPFNILRANARVGKKPNGTPQDEIAIAVQFLKGDLAGAQVNVSLEVDDARLRILQAFKKHGPHGPYFMAKIERPAKYAGGEAQVYYKLTTIDPDAPVTETASTGADSETGAAPDTGAGEQAVTSGKKARGTK